MPSHALSNLPVGSLLMGLEVRLAYLANAGPRNPTSGWIYQGIYNLYKIYPSMKIPFPPSHL
jgi:hypothetical protein